MRNRNYGGSHTLFHRLLRTIKPYRAVEVRGHALTEYRILLLQRRNLNRLGMFKLRHRTKRTLRWSGLAWKNFCRQKKPKDGKMAYIDALIEDLRHLTNGGNGQEEYQPVTWKHHSLRPESHAITIPVTEARGANYFWPDR